MRKSLISTLAIVAISLGTVAANASTPPPKKSKNVAVRTGTSHPTAHDKHCKKCPTPNQKGIQP